MHIKQLVKDLCKLNRSGRASFISGYLADRNITFSEYTYNESITNFEAVFNTSASGSEGEVLFFAHYDISPSTKEGANDNTSSVAVLLCLAKYLAANQPACPVRLIFNDTEEILGGLLHKELSKEHITEIAAMAGSFQYLKNIHSRQQVKAVFILELSGIGDSIYIAGKSGSIECSQSLNKKLHEIAGKIKMDTIEIPVLSSDMISVKTFSLAGTVFGAIPSNQAVRFLEDYKKHNNRLVPEIMPQIWNNMHTTRDTTFSIEEQALQMVFAFCKAIIKDINTI